MNTDEPHKTEEIPNHFLSCIVSCPIVSFFVCVCCKSASKMTTFAYLSNLEREFFEHVRQTFDNVDKTDEIRKMFDQIQSDAERIEFLYPYLEIFDMLDDKFKLDEKNDDQANGYLAEATEHFCIEDYSTALKLCTKVIMNAKEKEVLGIGFAKRSAALFNLQLYKECSADIERAIANNENLKTELEPMQRKSEELQKTQKAIKHHEKTPEIPQNHRGSFEFTSDCVTIQSNRTRKGMVATRDIQIGEVIVVESPMAICIGNAELYHCHFCFTLCYNPIPCDGCTQTLYCSETCQRNAFTKYHKGECVILLSLNSLLKKSRSYGIPINVIFYAKPEKFSKIFELSKLVGVRDFQKAKFTLTIIAVIIDYLLTHYTQMSDDLRDGVKDVIVPYLLFCLNRIACVKETVCQIKNQNDRTEMSVSFETVAFGIYYFNSLFRHSCCPNVCVHHYGTTHVMRAVRTIRKGEECCTHYGVMFTNVPLLIRQEKLLTVYDFRCTCRACRENWAQSRAPPVTDLSLAQKLYVSDPTNGHIELVKDLIQKKIEKIRRLEKYASHPELIRRTQKLLICYGLFGNKRLIK